MVATLLDRYLAEHGAELPVGSTIGPIRGNISFMSLVDTEVDLLLIGALYLQPEGGLTAPPALDGEQVDAMWYVDVVYTTLLGNGIPSREYVISTKAMRKITEIGQELAIQVDEVKGESGADVQLAGHIFIKLP